MADELDKIEYQRYVQLQLSALRGIFAKASVGDFSEDVTLPEGEDEFVELAAGVQIMIEVIRQRILDLETEIAERKNIEEKIRHQALHDPLTGLPNRQALDERLENSLARARRNNELLAVLYLDIDHFKQVNDVLGHHVGDMLLQEFATRLLKSVREEDIVARLGGDEFIIVLPQLTSVTNIMQITRKIFKSFEIPVRHDNHTLYMSTSIGVAVFPEDGRDILSLMANADAALMEAKQAGRSRYQFYNQTMNKRISDQLSLGQDLRQALAEQQILLYYQPIINIQTNQVENVEALIRWQHPTRGLILPGEFIPIAEELGIIRLIGERTIKAVCLQQRQWQEHGLPQLQVAVNLSPRQFADTRFVEKITKTLQEIDMPPSALEFEITESLAMENIDLTKRKFQALHDVGIDMCIDDFGIGYSSLNYLKRFPVKKLKVDRSFVSNCITDKQDAAIIQAVIVLGHSLNMKVVAEGVETQEQLDFLAALGCDYAQGFYIARPMPAPDLTQWILNR